MKKLKVYSVPYWTWSNHGYVDPVSPAADGPHKFHINVLVTHTSAREAKKCVAALVPGANLGRPKIVSQIEL